MKTSNKLTVATLMLLLGALLAYNTALRAEYRKGNYKNPFFNYQALPLQGFSEVEVPAAAYLDVKIVRGPYAVHLNKDAARYVHVTQQGPRLRVAVAYPKAEENLGDRETLVISCPALRRLTAGPGLTVAGKPWNQVSVGGNVLVQGFRQDSLAVLLMRNATLKVRGNTLAYLRAETRSGADVQLEDDNHIQAASLKMGPKCSLRQDCGIPQQQYEFSNQANAAFSGEAAHYLGTAGARE
jgi:hypothetical protein